MGLQVSCFSAARRRGYKNVCAVEPVPHGNHVDGAIRILCGQRRDISAIQQLPDQSICKGSHSEVSFAVVSVPSTDQFTKLTTDPRIQS